MTEERLDRIEQSLVRLEEQLKAHTLIHEREAVILNKDLEGLNDVRLRFVPREAYEARQTVVDSRIGSLENWRAKAVGAGVILFVLAGILGAIIAKALSV